jgi:hypothetical protein
LPFHITSPLLFSADFTEPALFPVFPAAQGDGRTVKDGGFIVVRSGFEFAFYPSVSLAPVAILVQAEKSSILQRLRLCLMMPPCPFNVSDSTL